MPGNRDDGGASNASPLRLLLPEGAKPLRRRIVWGINVGILVERLGPNTWAKHFHAHWQIVITFSPADCEVAWNSPSAGKRNQRCRGSQVWIVPPGLRHSIRWLEEADAIVLYIEPARVPKIMRDQVHEFAVYSLTEAVAARPLIADLCSNLRELGQQPEHLVNWRIAGAGSLLAATLIESHAALARDELMPLTGLAQQILQKMKEHIGRHGSERIPVTLLARSLGISPRHFRRLVRQITGTSPQEFVIISKVKTAKSLLQNGTHNVNEAARAAGFSDPAHLNRRMQAYYGVSPRAFLPRLPRPFRP